MIIYRPVKTNVLTQGFGESRACARLGVDKRPIRPFQIKGKGRNQTCPLGWTDFYEAIGLSVGHNGRDNATYYQEPLFFPVVAPCEWKAKADIDLDGGIGLDVYSKTRIEIDELPPQAGAQAKKEYVENTSEDGSFMYVKFRFWHALPQTLPI